MHDVIELLGGPPSRLRPAPPFLIEVVTGDAGYAALRRTAFCDELGLFEGDDHDDVDDAPHTRVLVARSSSSGAVLGGVRIFPPTGDPNLGWWRGGRLVARPDCPMGVGAALVRAAGATAESLGALRFDAEVLARNVAWFRRLGWSATKQIWAHGVEHQLMQLPVERISRLTDATKTPLGSLLREFGHLGGPGFVGDDAAPVPGSAVVASVDAILPAMVERDPEWAGWCGVLVGANDLSAMGASFSGVVDSLGSPDAGHAARVLTGLRRASLAWGLPVLGGHTQLGVPAALSVTAFGVTDAPVPGGGGRVGHDVRLTADLGGDWRPGYTARQWDSTSARRREDLQAMASVVGRTRPAAAKDVSMAGVVGTLGMLAEAGGVGAELDVAAVPRPAAATAGDWLTCFPGFAMLTADTPEHSVAPAGPAVTATCGRLVGGAGVSLVWPDGERTRAISGAVTGLGAA